MWDLLGWLLGADGKVWCRHFAFRTLWRSTDQKDGDPFPSPAAHIPLEEWPVMLNTRGDRMWMPIKKARRVASI